MTDVTVATNEGANPPDLIVKITLPGGVEAQINISELPDSAIEAIATAGFEAIARKANGMAKLIAGITKVQGKALEERNAKVKETVTKTVEQLEAGQVPGRRAATKLSPEERAVEAEAKRLAMIIVKDKIRADGHRQNAYTAKEKSEGCKIVLAKLPRLYDQARKNLAERMGGVADEAKALNVTALFGESANDPSKKAKPKVPPTPKKAGQPKSQLSAAQAGKVAPRQKPAGATAH